jgi:hypothetical protein
MWLEYNQTYMLRDSGRSVALPSNAFKTFLGENVFEGVLKFAIKLCN